METIRLAAAQTVTAHGPGSREANLEAAAGYAAEAARAGAQMVLFPESFPGAWRAPVTWTPEAELGALARQHSMYVVGSFAEPVDSEGFRCFQTIALYGPEGQEIGRYRRTTPVHSPWVYRGHRLWDFEWIKGDQLPVFDTDFGKVGLLCCSEVYALELPRVMALKGAELLVLPNGIAPGSGGLSETWRTLTWARAIENLMITATVGNLESVDALGLAMVCSPEEVLLDEGGHGVHVIEVSLDRVRWLREQQDRRQDGAMLWRTKPGLLRDWRRPELLRDGPLLEDPLR